MGKNAIIPANVYLMNSGKARPNPRGSKEEGRHSTQKTSAVHKKTIDLIRSSAREGQVRETKDSDWAKFLLLQHVNWIHLNKESAQSSLPEHPEDMRRM